jgi:hypothetical protein
MKIGNRVVLLTETLFVPDGETVEITQNIAEGDDLNIRLRFSIDEAVSEVPGEERKPIIKYELLDGWFEFSFENFTSSLGHSTNKPTEFALTNRREPISYMAAIYRQKASTKIDFQVMVEVRS